MSKTKDEQDRLAETAAAYLDLWVEHWASCLAAPETATALARLLAPFAGGNFDRGFGLSDPRPEPSPLRTAPSSRDGRLDELESRIARLERRLDEFGQRTKRSVAQTSRKPGRRDRKL